MEYVGIDLHKKESQICLLAEAGAVMECRIRTDPQRFAAVLGGRPRARILVEASTESEWPSPGTAKASGSTGAGGPPHPGRGGRGSTSESAASSDAWRGRIRPRAGAASRRNSLSSATRSPS